MLPREITILFVTITAANYSRCPNCAHSNENGEENCVQCLDNKKLRLKVVRPPPPIIINTI